MKNSKKIHCYINRKYLNCPPDKNSSSGNIIGASIVIENEDKGFEYKLYDIERYSILHLHTTDSWYITRYILKNEKAIRADKVKCEYDKKKMLMGEVNSISELIDDLINMFHRGRMLSNIEKNDQKIWGVMPGVFSRSLYYKQAKKILSFENKSGFKQSWDAVIRENPRLIPKSLDFGEYSLEAWRPGGWVPGKRSHYTYITFDKTTRFWLDKICDQASL